MHGSWFTPCNHGIWGSDNGKNCPKCARAAQRKQEEREELMRLINHPKGLKEWILSTWLKRDMQEFENLCKPKPLDGKSEIV